VGEGRTGADTGAEDRLTLRQAAAVLGVSESAVRKRVERGTLRSDKGPDGRRYVYLDLAKPGADTMTDKGANASATGERDALISSKDQTIAVLQEQLDAERAAHEQTRRLLGGALERIPELPVATPSKPVETLRTETPTETPKSRFIENVGTSVTSSLLTAAAPAVTSAGVVGTVFQWLVNPQPAFLLLWLALMVVGILISIIRYFVVGS